MKENSVLLEELINDQIVLLTINRPEALNAINTNVMSALNAWFTNGYKVYDNLKGVVITGSGQKAFVAGADITAFIDMDQDVGQGLSKFGHETYFLIERFHIPVIAAVNGFALGGGCELAMACHMRVASKNARFGQPEVNLGLIPGYGGTQRLPQLVGKGKAMEMCLTGDMINAEQAEYFGLTNYTVEQNELLDKSYDILYKTSKKGPLSITKTIEAINTYYEHSTDGFEMEYKTFGELMVGKECQEGVAAFIEKRKPNF